MSTEGLSDMKKFVFCLMAAAGILACNRENAFIPQEETTPQETAPSNAKSVKVYAGGPGTKTTISEAGGQFHLNWSAGDNVAVWEAVPYIARLKQDDPNYNGYESVRYESEPLAASGADAVFQLDLEERADVEGHGAIQYVAIYPASCAWDVSGGCWDVERHKMIIPLEMPTNQNPTADSFDPDADILVSKAVVCQNTRPDELSFQFARVGTIVKMVIADLPPGAVITYGSIDLGFNSGYSFSYDPELGRIVGRDATVGINFWYDEPGLEVGEDGKATVWLRSMSGISDKLELYVSYYYNNYYYEARRICYLRARGRTLEFKEGGLTEFTLGVPKPDVENPEEGDIDFFTNDAMDGVTIYWPVSTDEDFSDYRCSLVGEGRWHFPSGSTINNGIYSVTFSGLTPGTYSFYVQTLAVAGKVSQPDYTEAEIKIGLPYYRDINYVTGHHPYDPEFGLELDSTDSDDEDLYYGILYHHRNLFWVGGSPNHIKGQSHSRSWGLWNGTVSIRWSKIYVKASSYGTGTYSVYASDTFFQDGMPGEATALPFTLSEDGEKVFDLGNHHYFLICGNDMNAFHFDNIRLEYFK